MKTTSRSLLLAGLALALATSAFGATNGETSSTASLATGSVSCNSARIAFMGPLSGDASFVGTEQLSWAKYAASTLDKQLKLKVQLLQEDIQYDSALALKVGRKYAADQRVLAIIGPSTSGAVVATGPIFKAARLATISPSATRTSLTNGSIPTFFRILPNDDAQAPSDADFIARHLKAKKVYVIDDQGSYGVELADSTSAALKRLKVSVTRTSVSQQATDFTSTVAKIPTETDVVFLPWLQPERAQTFAQQMGERSKRTKIFGSDGVNDPEKFQAKGAYVSSPTPNITWIPSSKALVQGWLKANPGQKVGSFGPPTYGAVQVALTAIRNACRAGKGKTTRAAVLAEVAKVRISPWILGRTFAFDKRHDPVGARFAVYQIQQDGSYRLVNY